MTARSDLSSPQTELGLSIEDLHRISVAQYHVIAETGILDEDDPVELLEGWLVCKYGPFDASTWQISAPPDGSPTEEELGLTLAWIWRFSVEQYHVLIDAGILTESDPVELLGGWLIQKMTQKPVHPVVVDLLRDAFSNRLSSPWYVRTQAPITLPEGESEPDVALVRGDRTAYLQRHPGPGEIVLVAEVADTSLARDRGVKKQLYAQAGIPVYWIVNLPERKVEIYTEPSGPTQKPDYRHCREYSRNVRIPVVIDGVTEGRIPGSGLLP